MIIFFKTLFALCFSYGLLVLQVGAVTGGEATNLEIRDSLVNIVMPNGVCSGVLIAKNIVLSAAHCMDLSGIPYKVVLLSKNETDKHCNSSKVKNYAYTKNAKPIFPRSVHAPDLLMLQLESELCTGQPAKVMDRILSDGDEASLTGFGGGSGLWYKSQQIDIKIISPKWAKKLNTSTDEYFLELLNLSFDYYQYAIPLIDNSTACTGDSGGPVFINDNGRMNLYAITGAVFPNKHLGAKRCNQGYLHLVTPVAPYFDWINQQMSLWM